MDEQRPDAEPKPRMRVATGAAASVVIHAVLLAAILIGLPLSDPPQPPKEETVSVDIVPPPEKPPEPKPEEPPPPPPPPPAEQKPEPEKAEAPQMETPVLRPAFQFGEKESGQTKTPDGDGAETGEPKQDVVEQPPLEAQQQAQADTPPHTETEDKAREEIKPPEPEMALPDRTEEGTAAQVAMEAIPVPQPSPPKPDEVQEAQSKEEGAPKPALREARKIYSTAASGDMVAMMAMAGVPREQRASQLCATELREQLKHNSPRYVAEYLPNIRLRQGNVMEVGLAAFRASGAWYDISFRCEVDAKATKVTRFSYTVGKQVPRSEWAERRFPLH
ncbi:DUF930 domain-containing protein [Rhizobium helianthi]|uniref:DUF930 domain-containing protein n=1 Tax=Rhizobium helianthi TaxID=1132695 RepID=A0ABW4M6T3_9HYPH